MAKVPTLRREVLDPAYYALEVVDADLVDDYGPQVRLALKVAEGEKAGHSFTDYPNRDEDTGAIKEGSKMWDVAEACLGADFDADALDLEDLVGKRFLAQLAVKKGGRGNRVQHGTVGPLPKKRAQEEQSEPESEDPNEEDYEDIPF